MNCSAVSLKIWSSWSSWGNCVGGSRTRTCNCLSNDPQLCQGVLSESETCISTPAVQAWVPVRTPAPTTVATPPAPTLPIVINPTPAPTVPSIPPKIWSSWSPWGECLNGKRVRTCQCLSNDPSICVGQLSESMTCPVNSRIWSSWSSWGKCVGGKRVRTCNCLSANPDVCQGVLSESTLCEKPSGAIWSSWSEWSVCRNGQRTRTARCLNSNADVCRGILSDFEV